MSPEERLAVLETKVQTLEETLAKIESGQQEMLLRLTEYRGRWGGIVMTVTGVLAFLGFAKEWILGWFASGR